MDLESLKKKKGKRWIILYFVMDVNFLVFLMLVLPLEPYWGEINEVFSQMINIRFNIILFVIIIVMIPLFYGIASTYINMKKIRRTSELKLQKVHVILIIALITFYNILISLLLNELGGYTRVIGQVLEFYSFFIFMTIIVVLTLFLLPLFKTVPQLNANLSNKIMSSNKKTVLILSLISAGYLFALASPFLFVPANAYYGELPPKPEIIVHRGGAYLGPENTLEVAEKALEYGVVGWEVDIQISKDGVPFLMHDDNLRRTTNVDEIFPDRKDDPAETFTISELRQLDAGSWFVERDPFGVIAQGIITQEQAERFRNAKIPTFAEVLRFTKANGWYLDFDFKRPSSNHPYHDKFFERLLDMTIDSGIDLTKIMIPSKSSAIINTILFYGASDVLTGYEYENTGDGYTNEEYRYFYENNFPVMVYTIDSVEHFCELWCLGVTWVKTNAPHKFESLDAPILYIPIELYIIIWIIVYIAVLSSAVILKTKVKDKT